MAEIDPDYEDLSMEPAHLRKRYKDAVLWQREMEECGMAVSPETYQRQLNELKTKALLLGISLED